MGRGGAFCQNQDLRDYRILRILPASASATGKRLRYSDWGDFRLWRKEKFAKGERMENAKAQRRKGKWIC